LPQLPASSARPEALAPDAEIACARCGRLTPRGLLAGRRERERYRVFTGRTGAARGPYRYVYEYREHLVCPECRTSLERGGRIVDLRRRRAVLIILLAAVLAAAAAALTPVVLPQLLSAFWRTTEHG
jgi:hypothetical protein